MNLVVSPHLDDAVLSYGGFLGWSDDVHTVVTVFAGLPPYWYWPTPFDNACGFHNSRQAVLARRAEDVRACKELECDAVHLDFLDGQYGLPGRSDVVIGMLLRDLFTGVDEIAVPLGLAHPDHEFVALCCAAALRDAQPPSLIVYGDLPGTVLETDDATQEALQRWERFGWKLDPIEWPVDLDAKRAAWECYESQLHLPELAWENLMWEDGWRASIAG